MHGRLKVKTSAQQQEEKRKERLKKLKLFGHASAIAFKKLFLCKTSRRAGNIPLLPCLVTETIDAQVYDDEGLEITKQILSANSDYSTMWNYRKKAFLHFKETKSGDELQTLFKNELSFIESCLRNNPKSYGCWHHRCFVMLEMHQPDWKNELHLCDLYLQFDERNFHCWDYRKFVIKHSSVTPEQEIAFTNKLIERNFSNYSSWHYRSKLLPKVYPDAVDRARIEEQKLLEELELVQNAFFTDPSDQSAWFYHRWLLGRGETQQNVISLRVSRNPPTVNCCLRKPVKTFSGTVSVNDKMQEGHWRPAASRGAYSHLWVHECAGPFPGDEITNVICKYDDNQLECVLPIDVDESVSCLRANIEMFRDYTSDAKRSLLQDELSSCMELNDLEPGNKWVVLTLVLLMRAINPVKYNDNADEMLNSLREIDPVRKFYYDDLRSKFVIEDLVARTDFTQRKIDFSGKRLSRLCYTEFLSCATTLDISDNLLRNLNAPLHLLVCLKELKARNNQISEISGLKDCRSLEALDLSGNCVTDANHLSVLQSCSSLTSLSLKDNPVRDTECDDVLSTFSKLSIAFSQRS